LCRGLAQQPPSNTVLVPDNLWDNQSHITGFFEKEDAIGSSYLSKYWMRGVVEFTNHRRIPAPDQRFFFNFDKVNNRVYVIDHLNKISAYPIDSISSFELVGTDRDYSFQKVPWISNNFFLMPIIKSEKGYSLYKRLITNLIRADYSNEGYFTKGRKFDEFVDYYEYYITYPGNTSFRKLFLKENIIRRVLRDESVLVNEFFSLYDNEINEQSLLGMIQYINDKKFPE
jgi:hypothetical protein